MFACKRKLQAALLLLLSLWPGFGLTQNASQGLYTEPSGNQLDQASSVAAKSFEPPPEFYRGPGSNPNKHPSLGSLGESLSETYNKWQGGGNGGNGGYGGIQERITVGHYQGGAGPVASHAPPVGSFEINSHPYPYEYSHSSEAGAGLAAGGPSGAYFGSTSVEAGIPFDVYGSRPGHGLSHGHYPTAEYVHPYPLDHHEIAAHKGPGGHGEGASKALLAKSFLIPLASAAVLGIAAALISNPLLLQLGTVSGLGSAFVGKRKRRAAGSRHRRNLVTN